VTIDRRTFWLAGLAMPAGLAATGAGDATPAPFVNPPEERQYRPGEPIVLIGHGDCATRLVVDDLPTDRYGVVTVANGSASALTCTLETPDGQRRPVFQADGEDAWTGPLFLDQLGTFIVAVEAMGQWAVIIR
jgi:hypothetical protein